MDHHMPFPDTTDAHAFTVDEFCSRYRVARPTLYRFWRAGLGPTSYVIGAKRMISRDAADRWVRELEQKTKAENLVARDPVINRRHRAAKTNIAD
jgi:hypothetical protein